MKSRVTTNWKDLYVPKATRSLSHANMHDPYMLTDIIPMYPQTYAMVTLTMITMMVMMTDDDYDNNSDDGNDAGAADDDFDDEIGNSNSEPPGNSTRRPQPPQDAFGKVQKRVAQTGSIRLCLYTCDPAQGIIF